MPNHQIEVNTRRQTGCVRINISFELDGRKMSHEVTTLETPGHSADDGETDMVNLSGHT